MKKEIFAGALLLTMFIASIVNIWYLNKLTQNLIDIVETAEEEVFSGNWDKAAADVEDAARIWDKNDPYTHIVLRHFEIDDATDAIYQLLNEIYAKNEGGVRGEAKALTAQLDSLASIEEIKFGSIF